MWILYFKNRPAYWLASDTKVTIGRHETDIVILDDVSISRTHVELDISLALLERCVPSSQPLAASCPSSASQSQSSPFIKSPPSATTISSSKQLPPTIRVTDVSKYGSSLELLTETNDARRIPLCKTSFVVPNHVTKFILNLGTRSMSFMCAYEPKSVFIAGVPDEFLTKFENRLARCGCVAAPSAQGADLVLASVLEPTQDVITALCYCKPFVTIGYFEAFLSRASCKVPPPDPNMVMYVPPVDDFYTQLLHGVISEDVRASSNEHEILLKDLFLVKPERRFLFSDVTFVCIQSSLFHEVTVYLTGCHARVVSDEALSSLVAVEMTTCDAKQEKAALAVNRSILQAFSHRHQRHVVLYTCSDALPVALPTVDHLRATLSDTYHVAMVDYTDVLKAILLSKRLDVTVGRSSSPNLNADDSRKHHHASASHHGSQGSNAAGRRGEHPHSEILTRCTTEGNLPSSSPSGGGRKTAKLLFDDDEDEALAVGSPRPVTKRPRTDGVEGPGPLRFAATDTDGLQWISRESGPDQTRPADDDPAEPQIAQNDQPGQPRVDEDDEALEVLNGPIALPPYPCFRAYRGGDGSHSGKAFVKQAVSVSPRLVEFVDAPAATTTDDGFNVARPAKFDDFALNLFKDELTDVAPRDAAGFNVFETAQHHRRERKKATAPTKVPRKALVAAATVAPRTTTTTDVTVLDEVGLSLEPERPSRRGPVDIFAIDALF